MAKLPFSFLLCLFVASLLATKTSEKDDSSFIKPYLLPYDHPVKQKLDALFTNSRILFSVETMKKAGFHPVVPRKFTRLIVSSHPELKGYIIKAYLDTQRNYKEQPEYYWWVKRIEGAKAIKAFIERNGFTHLYKVPNKWIYELPKHPLASVEFDAKQTILIEEDMQLLSKEENKQKWKSPSITKPLLASLYAILKEIGLRDCCKIDNIPFSVDGRIAFIDTQSFNQGKPPFKNLRKSLGEKQKLLWDDIVHHPLFRNK